MADRSKRHLEKVLRECAESGVPDPANPWPAIRERLSGHPTGQTRVIGTHTSEDRAADGPRNRRPLLVPDRPLGWVLAAFSVLILGLGAYAASTLLRAGRGILACAVVGIGVRVVLYPVGFLIFIYLVLGAGGVENFVRGTRPLLEIMDRYLGVVGISLSSVGPIGLFAVFLLLWSIVAGANQALVVPLFIRRALPSFLNTDAVQDASRVR